MRFLAYFIFAIFIATIALKNRGADVPSQIDDLYLAVAYALVVLTDIAASLGKIAMKERTGRQ
jgi:CDP-diglyceride synthetase